MLLVRVSVAQLPTPIVLDADIGGNIADALALAMLLSSPALDLRTATTVSGEARARTDSLADRIILRVNAGACLLFWQSRSNPGWLLRPPLHLTAFSRSFVNANTPSTIFRAYSSIETLHGLRASTCGRNMVRTGRLGISTGGGIDDSDLLRGGVGRGVASASGGTRSLEVLFGSAQRKSRFARNDNLTRLRSGLCRLAIRHGGWAARARWDPRFYRFELMRLSLIFS
jgi:hypothetical protein